MTQQTQKDKVHLDGSGSGKRGAILTLWSEEMTDLMGSGSRGAQVLLLTLGLAGAGWWSGGPLCVEGRD